MTSENSDYAIKLENFEGPLDLLLHLIRQNEMDIYDIEIARITHQYLQVLDAHHQLNLDVAGEFLLMAATLLHIKSRLLLPVPEDAAEDEDELDPRAELVRRLLEYQKYKEAATCLEARPLLDADIFVRRYLSLDAAAEEDAGMETVGLYELAQAFQRLLAETTVAFVHEVDTEQLSVTDQINHILGRLTEEGPLAFADLFPRTPHRHEVVVSFLAMLELVKMRMVHLVQAMSLGPIWIQPAVTLSAADFEMNREDLFGYS